MNDVVSSPVRGREPVVRPRDAASLILLRGEGRDLEVLAGRRPRHVKFMPGVHVFPGGAIDPPDRVAWSIETGTDALGPRLARSARAALRETWEEVGVLVGRPAGSEAAPLATRQIERAYRER
ncbi:MAG: NUDIX domain-containing protein, partial [Alphaproteobacteria bacterium]|nr:NUDIX domain-containing protein [Alphaproteobacteria bacterium]